MGAFVALLRKDLRIIKRSRTLLVTMILYPLLMVSILGLLFAETDTRPPVAVLIHPDGNGDIPIGDRTFSLDEVMVTLEPVARLDIQRPSSSFGFDNALDAARDDLRNGEVDAVVVFPEYFLNDIVYDFSKRVNLTILLDESDFAKSGPAKSAILASVQVFNERVVRYKVEEVVTQLNLALNGDPQIPDAMGFRDLRSHLVTVRNDPGISEANRGRVDDAIAFVDLAIEALGSARPTLESIALPINPDVRHIDLQTLADRDKVVPATAALSIFWTGILAASSLAVFERESNAQLRLNVSPVPFATIISAKVVLTSAILIAQSLLIIGIAKVAWDIRIDSPVLLFVMLFASAFSAVGIGLLVAGLSRDSNGSTLLSILLVFPMMFLSGLFFPVSLMPPAARWIAQTLPMTYSVDGLRGAMLKEYTFFDARLDLFVLIGLGLATTVVGYLRNRRLAQGG